MLNTLNADSRFMLFGSRSKNAATDSSDWDFSAAYSEPLVDELIQLAYKAGREDVQNEIKKAL